MRHAAHFVEQRLPPSVVRLRARLPLRLAQSAPVLQAYVNDGETRCYVGVQNFYSLLLPDVVTEALAEVVFRDSAGRVVLRHRAALASHGSLMLDVQALFEAAGVRSTLGIVEMQLSPAHPRARAYRALGRVSAHFFVHYESRSGAVGQIDPLSTADAANRASGPFLSSQLVTTHGLVALEVIQYNATRSRHRLQHRLVDAESGALIVARSLELAPLGAGISRFAADELGGVARCGLAIDDLPSHNAKPVLRRIFAGGLYSVSHA